MQIYELLEHVKDQEDTIMKLQALFRGHMARKGMRILKDQIDPKPKISHRSRHNKHTGLQMFGSSYAAKEVPAIPDDYIQSNLYARATEERLGPFVYD